MAISFKFQRFIKELCDELVASDVEEIKFLFGGDIPKGKIEEATNSVKLFDLLERENIITSSKFGSLIDCLECIRRKDLVEKVVAFQNNFSLDDSHKKYDSFGLDYETKPDKKCPSEGDFYVSLPESFESISSVTPPAPCDTDYYTNGHESGKNGEKISEPSLSGAFGGSSPPNSNKNETGSKGKSTSLQLLPPSHFSKSRSPSPSPLNHRRGSGPDSSSLLSFEPRTLETQRSSQYFNQEHYYMDSNPHGYCVIFSNNFSDSALTSDGIVLKKRTGTESDVAELTKTFDYLKFTVHVHRDQSAEQMLSILGRYAQDKQLPSKDCFICCILSHGFEGGVYGNDGGKVEIRSIKKLFTGDKCPMLLEKPKLFFIQACQGDTDSKHAPLIEQDGPSTPIAQDHVGDIGGDSGQSQVYQENIAADADILFVMATTPGMVSWRDPMMGSWFVQTLCQVLQDKAQMLSLMDMLLEVNNQISRKQQDIGGGQLAKQMSNLSENTLRKQLYFFPMRYGTRAAVGTASEQ